MSLLDLIILIVIAGIIGAVGQAVTGYSRGGCLLSIVVGFVGALLGSWLARTLGLPDLISVNIGGTTIPIVWSIIGAIIFVAVVGALSRGRL